MIRWNNISNSCQNPLSDGTVFIDVKHVTHSITVHLFVQRTRPGEAGGRGAHVFAVLFAAGSHPALIFRRDTRRQECTDLRIYKTNNHTLR